MSAPHSARATAAAWPIPRVPPVIKAVSPVRLNIESVDILDCVCCVFGFEEKDGWFVHKMKLIDDLEMDPCYVMLRPAGRYFMG